MNFVILKGVVGSTAYKLNHEGSDIDTLGIYVAPIDSVLGLDGPRIVTESQVTSNPDSTLHELGKYVTLALKCNPSILELMFLDGYQLSSSWGELLVANRDSFLNTRDVKNAYGGYAKQQLKRLSNRNPTSETLKNLHKKQARHCLRLCVQGIQLLKTGEIPIDLSDWRDFLFEMGELAVTDKPKFERRTNRCIEVLDSYTSSVLPDKSDREKMNRLVVDIRKATNVR